MQNLMEIYQLRCVTVKKMVSLWLASNLKCNKYYYSTKSVDQSLWSGSRLPLLFFSNFYYGKYLVDPFSRHSPNLKALRLSVTVFKQCTIPKTQKSQQQKMSMKFLKVCVPNFRQNLQKYDISMGSPPPLGLRSIKKGQTMKGKCRDKVYACYHTTTPKYIYF